MLLKRRSIPVLDKSVCIPELAQKQGGMGVGGGGLFPRGAYTPLIYSSVWVSTVWVREGKVLTLECGTNLSQVFPLLMQNSWEIVDSPW